MSSLIQNARLTGIFCHPAQNSVLNIPGKRQAFISYLSLSNLF